jgi:hypothetical protein
LIGKKKKKKGGRQKKNERWTVYGQTVKVTDELSYLGVTLENTGRWNKQKAIVIAKSNQSIVTIGKFLAKTTDIVKVKVLENVYGLLCESRMIYGRKKLD